MSAPTPVAPTSQVTGQVTSVDAATAGQKQHVYVLAVHIWRLIMTSLLSVFVVQQCGDDAHVCTPSENFSDLTTFNMAVVVWNFITLGMNVVQYFGVLEKFFKDTTNQEIIRGHVDFASNLFNGINILISGVLAFGMYYYDFSTITTLINAVLLHVGRNKGAGALNDADVGVLLKDVTKMLSESSYNKGKEKETAAFTQAAIAAANALGGGNATAAATEDEKGRTTADLANLIPSTFPQGAAGALSMAAAIASAIPPSSSTSTSEAPSLGATAAAAAAAVSSALPRSGVEAMAAHIAHRGDVTGLPATGAVDVKAVDVKAVEVKTVA